MANKIPKLAGKFQAWKFVVNVEPGKLDAALRRCVDMGLDPNRRVLAVPNDVISFTVLCPRKDDLDVFGPMFQTFKKQMMDCGATVSASSTVACLICPLPGEE